MPWKDIEKQREAIRKHYYAHREMYIEKAIKCKKLIRQWVNTLKEESPCVDCGLSYPYYVMDFDHIGVKKMEINKLSQNSSMAALKKEISQCEIVCANCHRERTFSRLKNLRLKKK